MGVTSLVLGIIALILSVIQPIIAIILGVIGSILGYKAKNEKYSKPGMIISIIAIVVSVIAFFLTILLMIIATGSATNTIDNARRDTFGDIAHEYIRSTQNEVLSNSIECTKNADESTLTEFKPVKDMEDGDYYLFITTDKAAIINNNTNFPKKLAQQAETQTNSLKEIGGKSSWQNVDVYGWIHWKKENDKITKYYIALTDVLGHGIANEVESTYIKRDDILTKDAKADVINTLEKINSNEYNYYCHYKK